MLQVLPVTPDESALAKRFGAAVRNAREAMGWPQADLAERLGISTTHMGVIERGDGLASVSLMLAACKLLSISLPDAIAEGRQGPEPGAPDVVQIFRGIAPELRPLAVAVLKTFAKVRPRANATTDAGLLNASKASKRRP
jgi:transcriptional regulator with XRE-family HTH domain